MTLVNLRRARKAKARAAAEAQTAENRRRFGTSKSARMHAAAQQALERRRLASQRRDPDNRNDD
ncbi:MAG: DUF4169 family protein [Methylovirgula sp.]|jgi:Domain of unknown function (DUF4169)